MKTPEQIIELIREDAPCVFDILNELIRPGMYGYFPQSNTTWTWEDFYKQNPDITPPTPQELLDMLLAYSGDNYDVHYWNGRYEQMQIDHGHAITLAHEYFSNSSNLNKFISSL